MTATDISSTAQQRHKQRAEDVVRVIRWAVTTGDELRAALLATPPEHQAAFLTALQGVIEGLGR